MLTAPDQSIVLDHSAIYMSSTDEKGLWALVSPFDSDPIVRPYPGGARGELSAGRNGWYALSRSRNGWYADSQSDNESPEFCLIASRFDAPSEEIARASWIDGKTLVTGDDEVWSHLPSLYLNHRSSNDLPGPDAFHLGRDGRLAPLYFDWYWAGYDPMYHAPNTLCLNPITGDLLVGVIRSGTITVCDPDTGKEKETVTVDMDQQIRDLIVDSDNGVIWVNGYDTLFRLDPEDLSIQMSARIQGSKRHPQHGKTRRFSGEMVLQPDRNRICFARPASGDVIAVDMTTLEFTTRVKTGGKPLYLAVIGDEVIVREWESGRLLRSQFPERNRSFRDWFRGFKK